MPRSGIALSYGTSVFSLLRNLILSVDYELVVMILGMKGAGPSQWHLPFGAEPDLSRSLCPSGFLSVCPSGFLSVSLSSV